MAGASSTSTSFKMRIPNEVLASLKARAEARGVSVAALILEALEVPRSTEIDRVVAFVAKAQARKVVTVAKPRVVRMADDDGIDHTIHHPAGPVLRSAVPPNLTGEARAVPKIGGKR